MNEDSGLNEIDCVHETNYANDPQGFDALLDLYDIHAKWKRKRTADQSAAYRIFWNLAPTSDWEI